MFGITRLFPIYICNLCPTHKYAYNVCRRVSAHVRLSFVCVRAIVGACVPARMCVCVFQDAYNYMVTLAKNIST